jgi:hypothetical protein
MKNIYFYLLLGVFFYFIINKFIENYLSTQENFDPSLVPVSSIVTLAKVAQKLVNGNGTLTNPGSLKIGASAATPGNLTVTGSTDLNGGLTIRSGNQYGGNLSLTQGSGGEAPYMNFMSNDGTRNGYIQGAPGNMILSSRQTEVNDLAANGSVVFGGKTATGFKWTNETDNGWACLRSGNDTSNSAGKRLCFNKDHGVVNFHPGGRLELAGSLTAPGNVNASNGTAYSTRIGSIWNSAGIYAEAGTAGLELGAHNKNVYIGSNNGIGDQNLTVSGQLNANGNVVIKNSNLTAPGDINVLLPGGTFNINKAWGGSGNMKVDGNLTVDGNLNVKGVTKTQLIRIEVGSWSDGAFLDAMAPHFSRSDPDGTLIGFFIVNIHNRDQSRVQYGVKDGNRIRRAILNDTYETRNILN